MVSWLCKRIGWLCSELALQGNVVQARAEQGFQVQARTYINCSLQSEILKFRRYCTFVPPPPIVIDDSSFTVALTLTLGGYKSAIAPKFHVLALLCVMAPEECMMHNSQKIC